MPKIETTHLITLSEFVEQIKKEESTFSTQNTIDIIAYNDFLNQTLNVQMFDGCDKESIFCGFGICSVTGQEWIVGKKGTNLILQFDRTTGLSYHNWDLNKLAELTKDNPLRFRNMSIYYEPYKIEEL